MQQLLVGTNICVMFAVIGKCVPRHIGLFNVMPRLRPNEERNTQIIQCTMGQRKIIGGVRRRSLNRDDFFVNTLYLVQIGYSIVYVSGCHNNIQYESVVGIQCLMGKVMLAYRFSGAVHMTGFRVSPTDAFTVTAPALFEMSRPLTPMCFSAFAV